MLLKLPHVCALQPGVIDEGSNVSHFWVSTSCSSLPFNGRDPQRGPLTSAETPQNILKHAQTKPET